MNREIGSRRWSAPFLLPATSDAKRALLSVGLSGAIRKLGEPANADRLPAAKRTMAVSYKTIAGQSVERLAALSDGVLAVAMTLLLCGIDSRHEK